MTSSNYKRFRKPRTENNYTRSLLLNLIFVVSLYETAIMELVIKDIKSAQDIKLFTELAKRLGLRTAKLSLEEKEDIGLAIAIEKGRKTGYVAEETIMKTLRNVQGK